MADVKNWGSGIFHLTFAIQDAFFSPAREHASEVAARTDAERGIREPELRVERAPDSVC